METMLTLARVLGMRRDSLPARKLQPAFYLAQEHAGFNLYTYYVRHGRVLSDELDQDFAQLSSAGVVAVSYSVDGKTPQVTVNQLWGDPTRAGEGVPELCSRFQAYVAFDAVVLEAAATMTYFTRKRGKQPNGELQWFRALPEDTLEEARQLCAGT